VETPKQVKKRAHRSKVIAGVIVVALVVAAGFAAWGLVVGFGEDPSENLSRGEIESLCQMTFPPGACNIRARAEDFRGIFSDATVFVCFEMPAAERAAFLATTRCRDPLVAMRNTPAATTGPSAAEDVGPTWWDPDRFDVLEGTSAEPDIGPGQSIQFGKTESGDYVVYVYVFYI